MSLGDKQGDQNAIGDWRNDQKIGERGHLGLNHRSSTKKRPALSGSFFLPVKRVFR